MHVLVIGGGISGLAAAHRLSSRGVRTTVLEASSRVGGKVRAGSVAGAAAVDLGAESMLARRPEAVELARAAGLGEDLSAPDVTGGALWNRGEIRPMPKGHVMGVPGDAEALRGIVSPEGLARIAEDERLPRTGIGDDAAIGEYVAARLGREVVDRLVEPLLGGVYAGDAYRISMRAAVPQLYEAAKREPSLLAAVRAVQRESRRAAERAGGEQPPAFLGIRGGLGRLPQAVADACRAAGAEVRTGSRVRRLERAADGWGAVVAGPEGERSLTADAVVVAVPAPAAAELLRAESPGAAAELAAFEYASMALVTMAFRRREVSLPAGSGFLVPPVDGRSIKAATFSGSKWRWVAEQAPELTLVRTSLGRYGEERVLERDDAELAALARTDLAAAAGITAEPVDTLVTRWDAGLPQYPSGHQARVGRIRAALGSVPRLALCGAALDGVGIPACVASGRSAADQALAEAGQSSKREGRESHV